MIATPDLWTFEESYFAKGYEHVCGVDEAGAGPLAGRVYAAAVILPRGLRIPWINDSKKLTEKRRDSLFEEITAKATAWAVSWADELEVDELNILNARMLAMERALLQLAPRAEFALIDGNRSTGITTHHETVVKGDEKSAFIAAASILAKVSRDRYMCEMAEVYPQYGFDRHKGYATSLHYERLRLHGPCPIHRKSFLKKL